MPFKTEIKAVLFDLDETLIDAQSGLKAAHQTVARELHRYLKQRGFEVDKTLIYEKAKALDDEMNVKTNYDRYKWWPALIKKIGMRLKLSSDLIMKLTDAYWKAYTKAGKPYADAKSTLVYLKRRGYKLGIVTDTDGTKGLKERRVKHLNFFRLFDVVVIGGEDTPKSKPSSEPFLLAATKLGLIASECVMVGDKPFTDMKGAKASGVHTIWLKRRNWGIEEVVDLEIKELAELCKIF